jgi:serine/threonine-protein kinase
MAAEMSVDTFLDLLRQSGLLVDSQMLALMAEFSVEGAKPENARALADELVQRTILTEWQADNLLQGKHKGFRLGPYRILGPLGKGGMSQVYLAEHMMMRRRCAIKVLPTKYQEDPDLLSRFHVEARAVAALDHPHIVRAYDFNKDTRVGGKDIHYLVMEYVEGQDLRRMVDEQGPLDYRKAADFICQAAEGLAHAHAAGFVHRDIKPANLLVDPNGVLKILDLGLALGGEDAWQMSEGQSAVGTADYVAPEQVMDSRSVDGRADIYGLGYTFYFLLTGRRPFPKATLVELLMAHRVETPEPISKLRPDVPLELIEIIDRMTAKTPDLRFQTAKEVAEKLQAWLRDSESGREYSRISALMAAAMRGKQPGSENTPSKPESTENADLELAFLDDEPANSSGAKDAENRRSENARSPEADAREKQRKLNPGDSGRTAALPRAKADLLLELNSQPTLNVRPQFKHHGGANDVLKSPWLWVALAVLVIVVLLILAILFGSSNRGSARKLAAKDKSRSEAPSSSAQTPLETPGAGEAEASKTPTPAEENRTPDVPKPLEFPESARQTEPPEKHASEPSTQPPTPPSTAAPPAPKEGEKTPAPAVKPSNTDALLAGLTTISFRFTDSSPANRPLNVIARNLASDAVNRLRNIQVTENSPNVMEFDLKASGTDDSFTMVLTAELTCRDPDGKVVLAWKESKPVVDLHHVRQDPAAIKKSFRDGTIKFLRLFADAVHHARSVPQPK